MNNVAQKFENTIPSTSAELDGAPESGSRIPAHPVTEPAREKNEQAEALEAERLSKFVERSALHKANPSGLGGNLCEVLFGLFGATDTCEPIERIILRSIAEDLDILYSALNDKFVPPETNLIQDAIYRI